LSVHSVESGWSPAEVKEIFNSTDDPGVADPEERLSATPCAIEGPQATNTIANKRDTDDSTGDLDSIMNMSSIVPPVVQD